jgi:arginine decarboxylase
MLQTPPSSFSSSSMPLSDAMLTYPRLNAPRFHVPGHNGNSFVSLGADEGSVRAHSVIFQNPYYYDLTELEGLDVLSEPEGCIQQSQQAISDLVGVAHSFFLVNGSSAGLIAALLAAFSPGDHVLVPRNAHRSIISGLILAGLIPIWFLPDWLPDWGLFGGVTVEHLLPYINLPYVNACSSAPKIKGVVITSPTYEGIASPVEALTHFCKANHLISIVDEAHGSLFPFSEELPLSACSTQADCVVQSLHKTGGSLTQTALAHLPKGSKIDPHRFQQALNMVQTTSPSYVLLASLEQSCFYLVSASGQKRLQNLLKNTHCLRSKLKEQLTEFQLFSPEDLGPNFQLDPARLYLKTSHSASTEWAIHLEDTSHLSYESTNGMGALYISGLGLQEQDYEWFLTVFKQANRNLKTSLSEKKERVHFFPRLPEVALPPREAYFSRGENIPASQAIGRISKETIVHCPPGIPILFPGEVIQESHRAQLPGTVSVVCDT